MGHFSLGEGARYVTIESSKVFLSQLGSQRTARKKMTNPKGHTASSANTGLEPGEKGTSSRRIASGLEDRSEMKRHPYC